MVLFRLSVVIGTAIGLQLVSKTGEFRRPKDWGVKSCDEVKEVGIQNQKYSHRQDFGMEQVFPAIKGETLVCARQSLLK